VARKIIALYAKKIITLYAKKIILYIKRIMALCAKKITALYAKKIITLYIDDTIIRLMVTQGKWISKMADVPLDMSLFDGSAEDKKAELADKVKHLLAMNNIKKKKIILGISGLHCLSRPAILPLLPKAMQQEAMTREAKRLLPVPPEQLHISWQIISIADSKMQAFIVAIPRQVADTLLKVLNQVGLKPYSMDIKPLALAKLVNEATSMIIDVQPKEFDIVIMVDGIPQPVRSVSFPQEALSLADRLSIVKNELKRTIEFYNSNNPEKCLQPSVNIYVSGELADEPELYESLAEELGHQVLPLTSPLKFSKELDPSRYLVNVGLALKELPREAGALLTNINTLPAHYLPKPIPMGKLMTIPATAAAMGIIILMVMTIQDAAAFISSTNNQLDTTNLLLEKKQSQKQELVDSITAMEQKVAGMQKTCKNFIAARDSIDALGEKINGDLVATVDNMVDGLRLAGIGHSGGQLSLNGSSLSEVEVLQYGRNLDDTGRFTEVTVSHIHRFGGSGTESDSVSDNVSESVSDSVSDNVSDSVSDNDTMGFTMDFSLTLKKG
jgi:type IV pilus assembly protein PilM